jgi:sec-independent protein translocase protein TatA
MLLIFVIIVLIFGTSRLPELGRGIGEGIKNFKKSIRDEPEEGKKKPEFHRERAPWERRSRTIEGRRGATPARLTNKH